MSEKNEVQYTRLFAAGDAPKMATLVCTGYVFKIGEGHESKSGQYNVNPIEIQPFGGGRAATYQFLSRPEWFEFNDEGKPSFRPQSLNGVEGGKSMLFVYNKMINQKDTISAMHGLCGSKARLSLLESRIAAKYPAVADDVDSPSVLEDIFTDVLLAKEGAEPFEIGYILRQAREKTDEVDDQGKVIYALKKSYDLSDFWEVNDKAKKAFRKKAEKSAERQKAKGEPISFKVCFDDGMSAPF